MGYIGRKLAKDSPWFNFGCWVVLTVYIVAFTLSENAFDNTIEIIKGILIVFLGVIWLCCAAATSWHQNYRNKHKKEPELSQKQQILFLTGYISFFLLLIAVWFV